MTVDVHTHVWEYPCHLGEHFIADAKAVSGDGYKDIAVDLDRHWEAMQAVDRAVVLGFRARHVGVLVPNDYVAEYVARRDPAAITQQMDDVIADVGERVDEWTARAARAALERNEW